MEYKNIIENKTFDQERDLYNLKDTKVIDCTFAGPSDGESVLKEARNVSVENCKFSLRYPLWHNKGFELLNSTFDELTRAPIWYSTDGTITNCDLKGIKLLRECSNIKVNKTTIDSEEFGWKSNKIQLVDSDVNSVYIFFDSKDVYLNNVNFTGKYSFQYMHNLIIENSNLDTKDAFWHSNNVTVNNCIVKGEYLAWFSKNLTLNNCTIIGTQPFCYCENLTLNNCKMIDCDLAFEYSTVNADINGTLDSVKNPKSGIIKVDEMPKEVIMDSTVMDCSGKVVLK